MKDVSSEHIKNLVESTLRQTEMTSAFFLGQNDDNYKWFVTELIKELKQKLESKGE